jgi:hypothetical protein
MYLILKAEVNFFKSFQQVAEVQFSHVHISNLSDLKVPNLFEIYNEVKQYCTPSPKKISFKKTGRKE